jgi:hypothetical protein
MAGNNHAMLAMGDGFYLSLRTNGSITSWGPSTLDGQQNVPPGTYKSVAAGGVHGLAIRTDGTVAAWGWNAYGQTNAPAGKFREVSAGYLHSLGVRSDGTLAGWGANVNDNGFFQGQAIVPAGNTYLEVSGGRYHSLALKGRTSYVDLLLQDLSSYTDADTLLDRVVAVSHDATIDAALEWVVNRGRVDVAGQMHIESGSTLKVDASEITPANGMTFRLFASSLPAAGTFSAIQLPPLPPGLFWDTSNLYNTGTLAIVLPEPGALGFLALAVGISWNLMRRGKNACR